MIKENEESLLCIPLHQRRESDFFYPHAQRRQRYGGKVEGPTWFSLALSSLLLA